MRGKRFFIIILFAFTLLLGTPEAAASAASGPVAKIGNAEYNTLQDAVRAAASGDEIVLLQDINISTTINITAKNITLNGNGHIAKRAGTYAVLFAVSNNAQVTFTNITIDGDKQNNVPTENYKVASLVRLSGGSVVLGQNTVLQNNSVWNEGGGVYLNGAAGYINTFVMQDNALITNCESRTNGGGFFAALRNPGDSAQFLGNAKVTNNKAASGGGIYYRIYTEGHSNSLTLQGNIEISNNAATGYGGGVVVSNYWTSGSFRNSGTISLQIRDSVSIKDNTAAGGGGLYFIGTNDNDKITMTGGVLSNNQVTGPGGGVYVNTYACSFSFDMMGARITGNASSSHGGGIYYTGGGETVRFAFGNGARITGNTVEVNSGGGMFINSVNTGAVPSVDVAIGAMP